MRWSPPKADITPHRRSAQSLGRNGLPSSVVPTMTNSTTAGCFGGHFVHYSEALVAKPVSRILVINDEHLVLREFVKGLNAAARTLDNPLGITFSGVTTAKEALAAIESDGDLQAVLVDDTLYTLAKNGASPRKKLQMSALELVQRITRLRPELDVYILIAQEKEDDVVDALFAEAVDGYFYREERDYRGIYRILNAQIQERARTPFYDQLKNYVWMAKDQWHTPGPLLGRVAARQPLGQRLLRLHGRARVRRRPVGLGADARLADGAEGRHRARRRRWRRRPSARAAPSSPPTAPRPPTRSSSRRCSPRARSCCSTATATRACTTAWCSRARTRSTSTPR